MDSLDKRLKPKKMDTKFGTLDGAGLLMTIVKELYKYKLDLVGVQDAK
jgi:hypothetical protein